MSPTDMNEDRPADQPNRISILEQAIDDMRSDADANRKVLQDILQRLGPAAIRPASPTRRPGSRQPTPSDEYMSNPVSPALPSRRLPTRQAPSPIPTSTAGRKKISLRPSLPPDFNGDRSNGKAFLTSCRTYIRLCPEAFDDEPTKIVWAMSYMKSGRAGRWASREFEREASSEHGRLRFIDWPDFEEEFRKDFTPLDAEATAVNTLETSSYFQGKRTVDDYLDQFRDLIYDSGYTDPKTIVVKFRRGLDRRISAALAGMAFGRPSDTEPEDWYDLAVRMDQNRTADEAFQASHRAPVAAAQMQRPSTSNLPPRLPVAPPVRFAHSRPSPGNPVPMDIDAARKARSTPDTCRRCGATGHWAKDCDHHFDVRYMDSDELETHMENKLAAKDVAVEEPPSEEDEPAPVEPKDFVSRSG